MALNYNYQTILSKNYVFKLSNQILEKENYYNYSIIIYADKYYIKCSDNNLIYINDVNLLSSHFRRFKEILDTFICFEKNKYTPVDLYMNNLKYTLLNIDSKLLHSLQLQFALDKNYFK